MAVALAVVMLPVSSGIAASQAMGYTATLAKSRVYQGCPFSVTLTPTGAPDAQFAQGQSFTLSSGSGLSAIVTPPGGGGVVSLTMTVSGNQTVTVSSGGAFTDPTVPFAVTVLPALRVTGHTGAAPAGGDANNSVYGGSMMVQPIQGQYHLMFQLGDTVGFHIPYRVVQVYHRVNRWEVYDLSGTMVDSGSCDVGISKPNKSDTIICPHVTQVGAYSLYLYDTTVPAGTVDFTSVQRFVVMAPSLAGLPYIVEGACNEYNYQANQSFALLSNSTPKTTDSPFNSYTPVASRTCFIRRSFTYTPSVTTDKSIYCVSPVGPGGFGARIVVNGTVVQAFNQVPAYYGTGDLYSLTQPTYVAGTAYSIVVETFHSPDNVAAPYGWTVPNITFSDGTALGGTVKSLAGTVGNMTVNDYLALLTDSQGDHNEHSLRSTLGEGGSLIRYEVSNTSAASDFAESMALENAFILGNRDPARERRRIIFNFVDLATVQHQVDAGQTTLQTYSASGITNFINGILALGVNPMDFVIEGANEPQGENPSYYGAIMARLYAAVKAANPSVQVIGASTVDITAGSLNFQQQAIAASGHAVDAISAHIYNAIVGDYGDGKVSFDALAAWQSDNGYTSLPIWQTEQGADYPYHGTVYMRFSPRLILSQKLLLERYGLPASRDLYWASTNNWINDPTAYSNSYSMYPAYLALRTWADEIFGLTYHGAVTFGGDWDKQLWGNVYTSAGGGMLALTTNGASSFALPVTVSGNVASLAARTWDGENLTIPVSAGAATLPLDDMMLYVRVPAGITITPNLPTLGTDLALNATVSANSASAQPLSFLNDGITTGSTRVPTFGSLVQITTPTSQQDDEVVLDFGSPTTFNLVQISCPFPFQGDGTLLDFVVQSWDGVNWNVLQSVTQTVNGVPVPSVVENSRLDDYSDRANLFLLSFAPVTASKVRVLIYSASYGVSSAASMAAYGSVDTPIVNRPTIREIGVYKSVYSNDPIPPAGSDLDDPGSYGIPNLLRYALNLDPQAPNVAGLPSLSTVTGDYTTSLALTYTKVKAATDLAYLVEVSSDLVNWYSGGGYTEDVGVVDQGDTEEVTTLDLSAIAPTIPQQFMRLRVTRQ